MEPWGFGNCDQKHNQEDIRGRYSNRCDKEIRKQLEFGFWPEAVGQGRDGGNESCAGRKEEGAEKEIGCGKEQVIAYLRPGFRGRDNKKEIFARENSFALLRGLKLRAASRQFGGQDPRQVQTTPARLGIAAVQRRVF